MKTLITQLINDKGNPVANHFVINKEGELYLQSYQSIVAKVDYPFKSVMNIDILVTYNLDMHFDLIWFVPIHCSTLTVL